MKKLTALLLSLTLILSLVACAEGRTDNTVPTDGPGVAETTEALAETTAPPVSGGDLPEETWTGSQPTATPADLVVDSHGFLEDEPWPELTEEESAGGYVQLHNYVHISYINPYDNEPYNAYFYVPEFTLDSEDAKACNEEIREICDPLVEERIEVAKTSPYVDLLISYEAWHFENSVSLCVTIWSSYGYSDYLIYTLNTETGELMDNKEVARLAGLPNGDYQEAVREAVTQGFYEKNDYREDAELSEHGQEMLEDTLSDENLALVTLYLGENGQLMALASIRSDIGGSDRYWWLLPVETP